MAATLKCDTIQNASSSTANLTLDASGNATVGNTLVMGSSFKRNRIINGDMRIAQRGTTYNPSGYYQYGSVDRWSSTSNASNTIAQSTDAPTGFKNSCSISATSAAYPGIAQRIESVNCTDLVGQTITISAYVKKTTGTTTVDVALYYANSADNFGAITLIGAQTSLAPTPTSTWTRYSIQFTNLPAGAANGLQLSIFTSSGSTSDVWLITGVQLEVGSVATPYERQIYSDQLLQCQRYYNSTGGLRFACAASSTTRITATLPLSAPLRTTPSLTMNLNQARKYDAVAVTVTGATFSVAALSNSAIDIHISSLTSITDDAVYSVSITAKLDAEL